MTTKANRWTRLCGLFLLATAAIGWTACSGGGSGSGDGSESGTAYQIGDPVQDSTVAAIAQSEAGTDTLTMQRFQSRLQQLQRRMGPQGGSSAQMNQMKTQMVEQFVNRHVLLAEAERRNITADEQARAQRLKEVRGQFPDDSTFRAFLQSQNMTEVELRDELGESLRLQETIDSVNAEVTDPTAQEVEDFRQEQAEQVNAQHILFSTDQSELSDEELRKKAAAVLDSVQNGADFAELAQRHSDDPGSASRGGTLGYFSRSEMVEPFADAAFALQDSGDVTQELVETDYGYHIIKLTGRRTTEPMDSTQARQQLTQQRQRENTQDLLDSLKSDVTLRVNEEAIDPNAL